MTAFRNPVVVSPVAEDVLRGLSAPNKSLPPKLFYDAEGSALFEEITRTPEYYPTRTERAIFERYAADIAAAAGENLTLVELGAGSASKTRVLISAILRRQLRLEFHPVDVSPAALEEAVTSLNGDFPHLHVAPIVADYTRHLPRLQTLAGRKLVLFIGSTIGNFEPQEALEFLISVRKSLGVGDALLLGFDMVKDPQVLHAAYNDAAGVTARFNLNMLARINRELDADFDVRRFSHVAFWNPRASRIEMHLESLAEQTVRIRDLGRGFHFHTRERIHTENSYKFTAGSINTLLQRAGLKNETTWHDPQHWFSLVLARV